MYSTRWVIALGTAAVLLAAGCDDGGDRSPATVTATHTVTPSDPPPADSTGNTGSAGNAGTTGDAAPTGTVPTTHRASDGAALSVTGIRVGHHDGFDRVVFDLGGSGTPGWRVDYTDEPTRPGSGAPITVRGRSVLQVVLIGLGYPMDTGVDEYTGPNPVDGVHTVEQVHLTGVFEGEAVGFIGVDADKPAVRVTSLTNPTRLVVDLAHAG
ncbi:hypothetical protein GII33_14210 [Gordonia pseudamarae]|jgi:hypothetical protein|uniref:AMIN-like domain-containing protein n=1 Tax=Gordonia pseudamarae TaxID=2831662 RepID=A0ABX6IKJ5_9ACTN|nr:MULTISPECIES: hypothetical protein [Gordonia]MBD0023854.1 hypothetical protein [Gordonia sp. (in: high G+C Gram-positive bacteria)]QHN26936.1 hypothetical protein GII33_14210 [Gordonia pseudamarae]QHN35825.1 hypothetical protein GII31_14035 [Gordonia pseudamarae]